MLIYAKLRFFANVHYDAQLVLLSASEESLDISSVIKSLRITKLVSF